MAVAASGCAGSAAQGPALGSTDGPRWMQLGDGAFLCRGKWVLRTLGQAHLDNEKFAAKAAGKKGRHAMDRFIRDWVTHLIRTHHKGRGTDLGVIDNTVRQLAEAANRRSKTLETHRDTNGRTTALVQLRVDAAIEAWKGLNWNERGVEPFVMKDAARAFRDQKDPVEVCQSE